MRLKSAAFALAGLFVSAGAWAGLESDAVQAGLRFDAVKVAGGASDAPSVTAAAGLKPAGAATVSSPKKAVSSAVPAPKPERDSTREMGRWETVGSFVAGGIGLLAAAVGLNILTAGMGAGIGTPILWGAAALGLGWVGGKIGRFFDDRGRKRK